MLAGVGLYYGEDIHGVPPVLLQFVSRTPVLYEVNIFMTNRFVPVPEVAASERLLVEQLGVSGFYHVIARCHPCASLGGGLCSRCTCALPAFLIEAPRALVGRLIS
jgi:KUP system potassium uptake protein